MSQIGTLLAAPASTIIAGQSKAGMYLTIGDPATIPPLSEIKVQIGGKTTLNISNANLIWAYAQWQMQIEQNQPGVANMIKVATGQIEANTTYTLVNSGATTPGIFVASELGNGVPIEATTLQVNASSTQPLSRFSAIMINGHANLDSAVITFADDSVDEFEVADLRSMFALRFASDVGGLLAGNNVCVIDNTDQSIKSVLLKTTGGGAITVLVVRLPDEAFKVLQTKFR